MNKSVCNCITKYNLQFVTFVYESINVYYMFFVIYIYINVYWVINNNIFIFEKSKS